MMTLWKIKNNDDAKSNQWKNKEVFKRKENLENYFPSKISVDHINISITVITIFDYKQLKPNISLSNPT